VTPSDGSDTEVGGGDATVRGKPEAAAPRERSSLPSYRLGELLGRGGMGEVVLADDLGIGRQVAIKRMRSGAPSDRQVARFLREAKIQACLDHPAIVPVHEVGRDSSGLPYFTMKRLSGTTLSEVIKTGRESPQRLLRAFADVCLALELAHTRGFIHRDLKPANVMLGGYGEVYVIDWGLARRVSGADDEDFMQAGDSLGGETEAGTVMGTPGYMSPEQLQGEVVGPATDVYALGAILFEILTRRPVHPRGDAAAASTLLGGVLSPAASASDRAIPPELDALCIEALAMDPNQRPSAHTLAERVQRYLDGDRDLERRRAMAVELLATARTDLDSGDAARRGSAMKAAGRALALDPESETAAAIVAQLILEPPKALPPELAKRLDDNDLDQQSIQASSSSYALIAYFVFLPVLLWMGVRDSALVAIQYGLVCAAMACSVLLVRRRTFRAEIALVVNAVLILALSRITSSFLIVPTLAAGVAVLFAMLPQLLRRPVLVIGTMLVAWVAPLVLEALGIWGSSWQLADGRFAAEPPAVAFDGTPAKVFLIGVNVALVIVLPLFVRSLAMAQRDGRRQLEMQAWHLQHLIPG
jgi:serine/threonine protein kinase